MKKETVKRASDLLRWIEVHEEIVAKLDPSMRRAKERSPIARLEFKTTGGSYVHEVRNNEELLNKLNAIVLNHYQIKLLEFKNELEAL